MIPDNVTLVVKAPNQQIEDQNIECQSSWTVRQLKGHLSEVYPSKPSADEQKIIYSGQLLNDNSVLKDVLRTYESISVHTMHLVCTPKRRIMPEPKPTPTPVAEPETLRRRNVTANATNDEQPPVENRPETRQNDQNHTVEMQNYLSSFVNNYGRVPPYPNYNMGEGYLPVSNDPAMLANHMMMMQQAYLQYMQQYANMWQPPAAAAATPPPPETPAPAPPAEEEEGVARDWLDHLYAASRLAVLFSLVYLYGSPARLLLVLLLCAAGYLHQIGFFRDLQLNPQALRGVPPEGRDNANADNVNADANNVNAAANNVNGAANNVNAAANNVNAAANNVNAAANNVNGAANNVNAAANNVNNPLGENPNNVNATTQNNVNADDPQQSLLAVTWMIFTTFFASLIPDMN